MSKRKTAQLIYIETPLQLLSAMQCLTIDNLSILIIRNTNLQLSNMVEKSDFLSHQNIMFFNSLYEFLIIMQKVKYYYSINKIYLGDIRSGFALTIFLFFMRKDIGLLDDGTYSISIDQGGSLRTNLRYAKIKLPIMQWLLNHNKLERFTIFDHKITRKYKEIKKMKCYKAVKSLSLEGSTLKEFGDHKINNSIIYIQSGLTGWVPRFIEQRLYNRLQELAKSEKSHLIIFLHRRSKKEEIKSFVTPNANVQIKAIEFPVEVYYPYLDDRTNKIVFPITSALRTAMPVIKNASIYMCKLNLNHFYDTRQELVNEFYTTIEDEAKSQELLIREINI